jgi:RNA polymerase sigma-70 factor (ECF subfamily)
MSPTEIHSDEELLGLAAAGELAAFAALYERRQGGIYRFALRMSGSESIAEDVTQDVFVALLKDAGQFDPARGTVASYLYGMARNRVFRLLERDRSLVPMTEQASGDDDDPVHDRLIVTQDPLAELTRNELVEAVRQSILALPIHYREVIILCSLQEMSYAQAAEALGCAVGTVRSRLHRARELLVRKLESVAEPEQSPRASACGDAYGM